MLRLGDYRSVRSMDDKYILIQSDYGVRDALESVGIENPDFLPPYVFARVGDGEYLELWACHGTPFLDREVELIFLKAHEDRYFSVAHSFHAIGEVHKTKRFPKTRERFVRRILDWMDSHSLPYSGTASTTIDQYVVIACVNFGWLRVDSLDCHGVDRWHAYLER